MKLIRNILSILIGLFIGASLNMFIIMKSGSIIPLPKGVNPTDMESLKENLHLFKFKHFIMPFLAHALGTLMGAFIAGIIAYSYKMRFALVIGFLFLIGGVLNIFMLPSPIWFAVLDITLAYLPMAGIGGLLALNLSKKI